ncbi:MAG: glycosyltransferase [Gemmatimonadaceae bacterium]|nr:glycosyltransferase [Gemmatimonadaceae bacterium]
MPRRPLRPPREAFAGLIALFTAHARRIVHCAMGEVTRRGPYSAAITTGPDRTVLLFFEDVERDVVIPADRYLARAVRRIYHTFTEGQRVSGFEIAFWSLVRALELAGCRVVVNNYALARRHPEHPIGIAGYPHALERWTLPNPAVLGPGLLDHPAQMPTLMQDSRFRSYIVPCRWMWDLFEPFFPGKCVLWYGGLDVDAWPDTRAHAKDIDVLVYDKLRWNRAHMVPAIKEPVIAELQRRGLRTATITPGAYDHDEYRALLSRSKSMLFLCEHETQGLAYQEAMACNVPILAWDPEEWMDPDRGQWTDQKVTTSSVPYFSPSCGERFHDPATFPACLDRFLANLDSYEPREYVRSVLSFAHSADLYLAAYTAAARAPHESVARVD